MDPDTWAPPALPERASDPGFGAMAGARYYERPEHLAERQRILDFLAVPGPVGFEIGFDHGNVLLDLARTYAQIRWMGAEVRRARVEAAAPHAPPNALLLRGDARGLLASVIPPGRLSYLYVLFPSPSHDPRHLLLTPATVASFARALADDGQLHLATDVPGMARLAGTLLAAWPEGPGVPHGAELSRRDRVCRRDGRPVWRFTRGRPRAAE